MLKKTCLVYGHDGFDLCVLYNIISFYKSLNFNVFFSNSLAAADLLVVLRIPPANISPITNQYDAIHVYDYVGSDFKAYFDVLDFNKAFIFCSSENRRRAVINTYPQHAEKVLVTLAPVITKFWARKIKQPNQYQVVHIGNCKPYYNDGTDVYSNRFLNLIKNKNVDVWGAGWNLDQNKANEHGKLNIFKVPEVCSKTTFALGMMYPFQRDVTFSSRFWQAPLNGCTLLSEPGIFASAFPGIVETDYSDDSVNTIFNSAPNRQTVQNEAIKYWDEQYIITEKLVKGCLAKSNFSNKGSIKKNIVYVVNAAVNTIRKIKQKYN